MVGSDLVLSFRSMLGGGKGRGDPCSVLSLYVRRVVNQTDVCDVISLCKIRAVLISVFLLVAWPNLRLLPSDFHNSRGSRMLASPYLWGMGVGGGWGGEWGWGWRRILILDRA